MRNSLERKLRIREEAIYQRAGCRRNAKGQWDAFDVDASLHRQAAMRIAELEAALRTCIARSGIPDPVEACRAVIKTAEEALGN